MVRCFKGVLLGNAVVGDVKEVPHCVDEIVKTGNLVPAEIEAQIHEQRLSRDNLVVVDIVDQGSADTTVIEQIVVLLEVVHDVVAERDKLLNVQIGERWAPQSSWIWMKSSRKMRVDRWSIKSLAMSSDSMNLP